MKLTLLGTGGVTGAPVFGCDCGACLRARQFARYRRAPTSALIEAISAVRVILPPVFSAT